MTADAAILMDRFVSASSATDAHDSLQALLDGLKSRNEETRIDASLIYQDSTVLDAFITVLATSSYKDVPLEEGPSLVCRIYQELWKSDGAASVLLKDPAPGRLVESLLDVVSDTNQMDYTRVLGLQILNSVCTKAPSTAQSQLLSTPNGLHRLADLFSENNDAVRNELLGGVSQSIAKWPSCAKIWVFGEVCDVLMTIVIKEGGLTGGHVLVKDCLELVKSLVDPTLADLIWQSPIVAPKLASLLDLRGGTEFINPPKPTVSQSDDLDDILATGNKKKVEQVLPKLTYNEEDVVIKVLHILGTLLDNAESRPGIWKQHGPLCSLVWELALVSKPPSGTKPVCALPSAKLQQLALETTSKYFHDAATMKQHFGVDRLLYIVCTGGGSTSKWEAKLGLSQAALHVLRQTLPEDEAREILTHTLAPPMHSDDDDKPPLPTVVQKLLNTVFENMQDSETTLERRRINLLGALGALSVFIRSPTDKEIMLGISSNLVDTLLQSLEQQEDHTVRMALLRFACEWVVDAPTVVQAFLASSHSVVLSVLLGSVQKEVATMVGFLLGLFMEYILGNDEQHGGWTKKSIMELLSKRKGGISGYTTDLEQLKKADLPWTACELEWHLFIKWYSAQVLAIRRCVVHELTAGGETDEDEDGVAGNGTSNASTKSLNRLVSQQAAELEELRMSLSEAKATIESQDGQLAVWKRRVESNPTQLDKMLSEYTDKNDEMENEVSTLHKQMQEKELEFNARLKERDDQIAQLQATVQEWQTRELESRQERDDLRGELEGLTSAYATLEQEYNRRDGAATQGAAPSAPSGEHPAQQHEGEGSQQDESTGAELATLRAENARLRSDAQAADDWMAMAVQRMNDIGGQNQTLQQEVATLQGQLQQAQLTGGFVTPVVNGITQEQFDEECQNREQVERQLVEAKAVSSKLEVEISALRQQLEESTAQDTVDSSIVEELKRRLAEEEIRRQELEAKLKSAQTDTTTAMDSLGDSKSERERLEREVAALQDELQVARSEMDALCEWRDERDRIIDSKDDELENMQSLLSSKDVELLGLRQQLSELRDSVGAEVNVDVNSQELVSLRESVQSLSASLEKTRQELDETASREREEIQRRDERIRELELSSNQVQSRDQPPWDAAGFSGGSEGIDSRDEEIKSLREANEAAQEWMAKAVEHHQMLSDQVSALTEDKAALTKEINDLQQSSSAPSQSLSDASNETIGQLKRELSDRTTELTNLGAKIIKLESEVRIKETEMAGVQEIVARCDQLQMEVDSLQLARDAKVEKALELEKELAKVVSENEELSAQIDVLRQDLDEKERLVASCADTQSEEMELLRGLLRERESVIVGLREELEDAKDSLAYADKVRRLLQESKKESSRFQADLLEAQSSLASVNDKTASFEQLQAELESLREAYSVLEKDHNLLNSNNTDIDRLRDEIAWTKSELKTITEERDSLNDNVSQLETQLSEFQTWANAAQEKIAELQNERDIADQASKTSLGAELSKDADTGIVEGLRDEVASVKRKLTDAITERDALKETVSGLESRLSEFQAWADLAQLKITELQNQNEALELSTAKPAESAVTANNKETDSLRKDMASAKNEIASLTTERDDLKKALSEMETQLSELQSWSDAAQSKIAQLETEKDALEAKAKDLADSAKDINKAIVDSLREEIASTKSELESVTTERDFIKENVREMENKLSEFQSWSDTAQLKISDLQQEKDDSEKEIEKLVESQKETMEKLESIREEMVMKSIELSNALEEKNELQEANANLDSKLEKTKLENNNLYAKNSSLEQDVKVLETQCNDLREKSNATDALLKEKDEALLVAETSITELETALESLQEQSAGVVDEWKAQVEELESTISELEEALQQQQAEASDAVEQWSARWSELDAIKSQLETKLEALTSERDDLAESLEREKENGGREKVDQIERERNVERGEWNAEKELMQARIDDQNESLLVSSQNITELETALESLQEQSAGVVDEWKAQVGKLESTISELEEELQEQQAEASDAVEQWSARWSELDAIKSQLETKLEALTSERDDLAESLEREKENGGKEKVDQIERERNVERGEWNAEKELMQARIDDQNESLLVSSQNITELETALESLQEQSAGVVDEWKAQVGKLESTISELEEELQEQQAEASDAVEQWSARWSELDAIKSQLETKLEALTSERDDLAESLQNERENGGRETIRRMERERNVERAEWNAEKEVMQARIHDQNESLLASSQSITAANEELAQMRTTAELTVDSWKDRVSELEDTISQLEQELSERRDEAAEAIALWESHCATLEARAEELENELQASAKENEDVKHSMERSLEPLSEQLEQEMASRTSLEKEKQAILKELDQVRLQSEDVIHQWTARAEELESTVNELENQLEAQQEEATKAISQWETSYSALETKANQLEEELFRSTEAADRSMNDELRMRQEEILTLKKQVERLQKDLACNTLSQEQIHELESSLAADQQTLKEAQANLADKQELVESLETQLLQLRQEIESNATETNIALEIERAARESAERDLAALQETVSETEEAFATLCSKEDQIFSEGSQSKEDADRIRQLLQEKESEWHEERGTLIQELGDLKATLGELEEELRDASDALQACVTDEISEKATEVASQALRYQMEQLRSQIERDKESYVRERNLRLAAEKEVEALKTDLINVMGYIDKSGDTAAAVQGFTMRASEAMQRREREELDEMRKALERALHELKSAQAAERKALEDAASTRLQLTVCEQEVLAAKSDLAFLTQTLEESREAEASKAASLEYRISSLEDDREVLRQFHQDELENLRNELTHVSMEKDRILHSLKESEKKNAAIVFSTSKTSESDGSASPEAELSRLRVERAQLLTAAAEEGSRTEGRIREAVAAHVSSMEADIILERELRVAAEAAVEDIKFQMEALKEADRDEESREPTDENVNDSRSESFLDELSAELKQFKEENRVLSAENDKLREELETANEKSQAAIDSLTEKWRKAQAKAHMLESSDRFDAEVNVEVAKLRSNGDAAGGHPRNWIVVHENDNPARDEGPPELSPVEAYDLIQQQKIAIQEERAMYLELLAEHDDLLALLAQQDLEKASLNAALSRVAGPEAVRAAMTDAEENAVKKYGKYLKLSP